jgi:hypothetical protein
MPLRPRKVAPLSMRQQIPGKNLQDDKNHENTLWRSNKSNQRNIPGMGKVGCQRIGLGSHGMDAVAQRVQHCGSEQVLIVKKQNYEIVKATSSLSHLKLTCFLHNPL